MLQVICVYELVGGDRDITFEILENEFYDLYLRYDEKMIVCVDHEHCLATIDRLQKIVGGIFFVIAE